MASNASPNVHGARPFGQMVVSPWAPRPAPNAGLCSTLPTAGRFHARAHRGRIKHPIIHASRLPSSRAQCSAQPRPRPSSRRSPWPGAAGQTCPRRGLGWRSLIAWPGPCRRKACSITELQISGVRWNILLSCSVLSFLQPPRHLCLLASILVMAGFHTSTASSSTVPRVRCAAASTSSSRHGRTSPSSRRGNPP